MKQKVLVLVGPTASGKSALAVELATTFNGEVISADSRQVYTGLNIGAGKITKKETKGVSHHLLDVAHPKKIFTAGDFLKRGKKAIDDITARGKLPIICGGTGFYIDALLERIALPEVVPNKKLRTSLENKSAAELFSVLKKLDPVRAETIDHHNPVRLIRAIEIATELGAVPPLTTTPSKYDTFWIGISWPEKKLRERIHARALSRMKRGMVAEAKRLHAAGLSYKRMEELGLEYRSLAAYLRGKLSKEALIADIELGNIQYAKRQMKYWKRNTEITWFPKGSLPAIRTYIRVNRA